MSREAEAAGSAFCVGLDGWTCRVAADTDEGRETLARLSARRAAPDCGGPMTLLSVQQSGVSCPRLRLTVDGQHGDFAPLFSGPGGKRFSPVPHPTRCLYADQAVGGCEPTVALEDGGLAILRPDLWPLYLMHCITWRMLCEHPVTALHAAVCAAAGVALVLIGPSGSGKSTLCWALAGQGADYFSDECAFFNLHTHHLSVWPHRMRLRPGGVAQLNAPPVVTDWQETRANDPKFGPLLPAPSSPCPQTSIVLLFIEGFAEKPGFAPLGGGEAARRVMRAMAHEDPSVLVRLETAADLVSHSSSWALTLGPPDETAKMLLEKLNAEGAAWRQQ